MIQRKRRIRNEDQVERFKLDLENAVLEGRLSAQDYAVGLHERLGFGIERSCHIACNKFMDKRFDVRSFVKEYESKKYRFEGTRSP